MKIQELFYEGNDYRPAINARFLDKFTVLHEAAQGNCIEAAKELFKNGADVNALTSMDRTPLILAVERQNLEMVKLLLGYHAILDI